MTDDRILGQIYGEIESIKRRLDQTTESLAYQHTGSGAPSHIASEGVFYWDYTNDVLYANSDGGTTWVVIGGGGTVVITAHNMLSTTHLDSTEAIVTRGALIIGIGDDTTWQRRDHPWGIHYYLRSNAADPDWTSDLTLEDDAFVGRDGGGRLVFDSTPSPDQIDVTSADLYFATTAHGIIHVDGNTDGNILVADGTRYIPGTISDIGSAPNDAQYVVMALDADLSAERVLTAGDGIAIADGGANSTVTVAVDLVAAWSGLEFSAADLRVDEDAAFTWTANHTWDDGAGNSPSLILVGASDDQAEIYLRNSAVPGESDLTINLPSDIGASRFEIRNNSATIMMYATATGDLWCQGDFYLTTGDGIIHADGVAAGQVLVADGTRYVPGDIGDIGGAPNDAQYVVLALDGDLSAERVLTSGNGLAALADTGANGTITVALGTPSTLTVATANGLTATSHTHAITSSSNPGAAASILATDANGYITLEDMYLDEYLWHTGDTNTYLRFQDDRITLGVGGVALLDLVEAGTDYVLFGARADLNGNLLIFDADADSYAYAVADDVIGLTIGGNLQYEFDATELTFSAAGGGAALYIRTHGDVQATSADIRADTQLGLAADDNVWVFIDASDSSTTRFFSIANDADAVNSVVGAGGKQDLFRVTEAPLVSINDTASGKQTIGLTIQQDGNDDEILALKSTDVTHGATSYADTGTFCAIRKAEGAAGGARIAGFRDSGGANDGAMWLQGYLAENVDTTKTTAGRAIVEIHGWQTSGASATNTVADGNVWAVRTQRGGSSVTLCIVDEDGDFYYDGALNNYDAEDDALAIRDLQRGLTGRWAEALAYDQKRLQALGVLGRGDGDPLVSTKGLAALMTGAISQLYDRCQRYEQAFAALGVGPAQLEA